MPRKKGQFVKGGFASAKNTNDALDIAMWGELAKSPILEAVFVVWSSRFPGPDLPPKEAEEWRASEREWEEKLGALVVQAVKEEDEEMLTELSLSLQHCKTHSKCDGSLTAHDKLRTLALLYYLKRGAHKAQPPVTSKDVRDYLVQHLGKGQEVDQQTVYRLFKKELRITLAKAKRTSGQ